MLDLSIKALFEKVSHIIVAWSTPGQSRSMTEARQLVQRKQIDEGSVSSQVTDSNLASAH